MVILARKPGVYFNWPISVLGVGIEARNAKRRWYREASLRLPEAVELQLRGGALVTIAGGAASGAAGDNTNVSHTFQPSGRFALSNSP